MAFLVTDEALESLLCNTCHKFLSVQPIKVYPNRKIKCGRCSEDGDAGVVSLFNILAVQCLFKCVNRFDGCRKLLTYSEVSNHESKCVGKSYHCPICPSSTMVPTFLMIAHFKKEHESMYLSAPLFFIDLNVLDIIKYFLYRHQNRLFIVMFRTNVYTDYITMSSMLLGDPEDARNISQRFTLGSITGFKIHSREKSCEVFDMSDSGLNLRKSDILKYTGAINLTFKINILNVAGLINLPGKFCSLGIGQSVEGKKKIFMLRNIFLDGSFRKTHPEFSIGSNFTSLINIDENKIESEIVLCCWNCSSLNYCVWSGSSQLHIFTVKKGQKHFLSCYYCPKNLCKEIVNDERSKSLISVDTFKGIFFFCIWKCGNYSNIDSLYEHEMNCSLQPFQRCPVQYCNYENKLSEIKQHIRIDHSREYSVFTEGIGSENRLELKLLIGISPIKNIAIVAHKLILMELVWIEPQWKIRIFNCNPTKKCDKLVAVALMYDEDRTLLVTLKENETAYLYHRELLMIKFYFELNNKYE